MAWPRLMAIAEVAWSPKSSKDWNKFAKKVEGHFAILDTLKIKYANLDFKRKYYLLRFKHLHSK
jgi:hexosaminidase